MKTIRLASFALLSMTACMGTQQAAPPAPAPVAPVANAMPEWVNRGSAAFGGSKKELYAVGSAYGIKNRALLLKAAQNSARNEMQKMFSTYTASLMKQFSESVMAGDPAQASESQMVSEAIKTFSAGTISGVQVVQSYYDAQSNTQYALAQLDLEGFKNMVEKADQLSANMKEMVKRAAEKAHADLDAEESKSH